MLDKALIKQFHAAMNAANLSAHKRDILAGYGVESSLDLTAKQARECIAYFNREAGKVKDTSDAEVRRQRSIVLTLLNQYGIYVTNNDWGRVNAFLSNPRIAGKLLPMMSIEEMKALQRKLRVMIADRNATKDIENFQAANN